MTDDRREPLSELDAALGEDAPGAEPAEEEGPAAPDPMAPVLDPEDEGVRADPQPPAGRRRGVGLVRGWVIPAVALILALSTGLFVYLWLQEANENAAREAVQEVAERFTQNLITFDYRTLDSDLDRIREDATGNFQGELEAAFAGDIDAFREALREARAQSSGSVLGSIVRSLEGETARALVLADQRIENAETPEPREIPRRIELTLVETSQGWKVDRVDASGGLAGGG